MKKLDQIAKELNDEFRNDLKEAFRKEFDLEIMTDYNFITNSLTSKREDGQEFTNRQVQFIQTYESGYAAAMLRVRKAAEAG